MNKIIALLYIMISMIYPAYAQEFKYKDVLICSSPVNANENNDNLINPFNYIYIHIGENNRYVISTNNYQYSNFEKIKYNNLYNQVGGTTFASINTTEKTLLISLIRLQDEYIENRIVQVNTETMSFSAQIGKYKPISGTCRRPNNTYLFR